jgi:hypothetical protein
MATFRMSGEQARKLTEPCCVPATLERVALGPVAAQERRHRVECPARGRQVLRRVLEDVVQPFEDIEMHLAALVCSRLRIAPRVVEQHLVTACRIVANRRKIRPCFYSRL